MKMIINDLRQMGADALHCRQVFQTCQLYAFQATKLLQQGTAAGRAQPRDIVQHTPLARFGATTTVPGDGKTVCLITHPLHHM